MSKYIGSSAVNLSTTSADVTGNADIDGNLTVGGNLTVSGTTITVDHATAQTVDLGDGDKIRLGDGNDLQIYHNSANNKSYIEESGTGNLVIRGSDIDILSGNGEAAINVAQDGAVTLYNDNNAKLATTSSGIDVSGGIVASPNTAGKNTFELSTSSVDEGRLRIKNVDTTTVQIRAGGDSYFNGGKLLVGKTSSNYATEGVEIRDNEVLITKAGTNPLSLRNNGTGGLISFNSAGVSVGGIGASGGSSDELYIYATAGKGILLNNNGLLAGTSSGGGSDNTTNLGQADVRFKDLYLSGGVNIYNGSTDAVDIRGTGSRCEIDNPANNSILLKTGGTTRVRIDSNGLLFGSDMASANALDDYEEGNWSPGTSSGTISFVNAKYTKIGRSVTVSALIYNISDRSSSNVFTITNLPFTSCGTCRSVGAIMMRYQNNTSLTAAYTSSNTTSVEFYGVHAGGWDVALHSDWNNINSEVYFTVTYNAD